MLPVIYILCHQQFKLNSFWKEQTTYVLMITSNSDYKNCFVCCWLSRKLSSYRCTQRKLRKKNVKSKCGGAHWPLLLMRCYHPWATVVTDVGAAGSLSGTWTRKGHSVCVGLLFRIGVLCAYAANQNLSSQVKNIRRLVNSNMRDLHTFANDTPMVRVFFYRPCGWIIIALPCVL